MRNSVTLKCGELNEQVWAEPMILLATRYGITGTGLAKICRKLSIPVPPRGYWQRPLWSPRERPVGVVGEERPGGEGPPAPRPADRLGEWPEEGARLLQTAAARRCMICPRGENIWGVRRFNTGEAEDGRG